MTVNVVQGRRPRTAPSVPLLRYSLRSLAGPWVGLLALAIDLVVVWVLKDRAWRGDWTWGVWTAGVAVLFSSIPLTAVAAWDASRVVAPARVGVLVTAVRPWRELVRVWAGVLVPALAAHLLALGSVIVSLLSFGADRAQTVLPLVQTVSVLGCCAAVGVFLGVFFGPRLGPFLGAVAAAVLVYYEGYGRQRLGFPTAVSMVTTPSTGFELTARPILVQAVAATVLTSALLLVASTRLTANRAAFRSPLPAVAVMALSGWLVAAVTAWLVHGHSAGRVVPVEARHCAGTAPRVCLTTAHRELLASATADLHQVYVGASAAGVPLDALPAQVVEGGDAEMRPGRSVLSIDGASLAARRVDEQALLGSLIRDRGCISSFDDPRMPAYSDAYIRAQATLAKLGGLPPYPDLQPMSPTQLARFLRAAAVCDLGAAAAV